jgi:tRNA threonylcarbamoyladenosine biosynthesis protein TsaB
MGKIISVVVNEESRNHASAINNMIMQALNSAQIRMMDLSAIAVCSGPGSYTGLRIAMATAKGICYALDIPMLLNDRLQLMAGKNVEKYSNAECFAAILVAREGEYFMGIYNKEGETVTLPAHYLEEGVAEKLKFCEKLHITTNASENLFYKLKVSFLCLNQDITLDFHYWGNYAFKQFQQRQFTDILYAAPQYLKQVYTHK